MAGKRQHYVPKFLQRGFLAHDREERDGECTWWHFRGNPPKRQAITHIGVREHFYSRPNKAGLSTLDDEITERESGIQATLAVLRNTQEDQSLDSTQIAQLVIHFVMRTAFVRSTFVGLAQQVVEGIVKDVGSPTGMRRHIGVDDINLSPQILTIVDSVNSAMESSGVSLPPQLIKRWIPYLMRERFDHLLGDFSSYVDFFENSIIQGLPKSISNTHQNILTNNDYSAWESALSKLFWKIHPVEAAVLPDCIAIARTPHNAWAPLLLVKLEKLDACVFPIDNCTLLCGSIDPTFSPVISEITDASVRCSDQFFISSYPMATLSKDIGGRTAEMILSHVNDALTDVRPKTIHSVAPSELATDFSRDEPIDFSYTLEIPELDEPSYKISLQRIVTSVVRELSHIMPLETLDGITFAVDYQSALEKLDRGDPYLSPDLSEPRDYGVAVSKCVTVVRQEKKKQHIVLDLIIAAGFFSDKKSEQEASLHLLVSMLAQVAHEQRYVIPLGDSSPAFPNGFTKLIHRAAALAPGQYYAARAAAFANPSAGERYAVLFQDCLHASKRAMTEAHIHYNASGDINIILETGLKYSSHLIAHAAQWCGHQDDPNAVFLSETEGENPGTTLMNDAVASLALDSWLLLLHQDLRNLYESAHSFNVDHIFALSRHVERILWAFHVCPWPIDEVDTYVSIFPENPFFPVMQAP